jgi:hypothetical protein
MSQKRVHALIFNFDQVSDHAHPVFGAISGIQLLQPLTWHFLTFITEMGGIILNSCTVADNARPTTLRFVRVVPPTSRAFFVWALKSQA